MSSLWAEPEQFARLAAARRIVFLVGSYDGSGNYGDVLQIATAIKTVGALPSTSLPVAIVERETLGHHRRLVGRYPSLLGDAVFLHYQHEDGGFDDELVEVQEGVLSDRAAIHIYGGGFLNKWWGGRKIEHAATAERLIGDRALPVVASGLQVEEPAVAPSGIAHPLLSRAAWIGARDVVSLQHLMAHVAPNGTPPVALAGDDAMPFLNHTPAPSEPILNLHLNDGGWVSEDAEALAERAVSLVAQVSHQAGIPLQLQPVIAYEDPRVSERALITATIERFDRRLRDAGLSPIPPVNILADAVEDRFDRFGRARLTVSCSYHVTLSSLIAGIPAVLLVENDYYEQKAHGLRDLFDLDEGLIGVGEDADAVESAAAALVDGDARSELVDHLRTRAKYVVDRYERGRADLAAALAEALPRSRWGRAMGRLRSV